MNANINQDLESQITEWIGWSDEMNAIEEEQLKEILEWLNDNSINMENLKDVDKVNNYLEKFL